MIGYMLQQALKNNLPQRSGERPAHAGGSGRYCDPAFSNPTKYIGPVYSEAGQKRWPRKRLGV